MLSTEEEIECYGNTGSMCVCVWVGAGVGEGKGGVYAPEMIMTLSLSTKTYPKAALKGHPMMAPIATANMATYRTDDTR